jgi:AraC-like DNA-binding protein
MLMKGARPLDHFPLFRTRDPLAMEHALRSRFGVRKLDLLGERHGFAAHFNHVQLGPVGFTYGYCSAAIQMHIRACDVARLAFGIRNRMEVTVGTKQMLLKEGNTYLTSGDDDMKMRAEEHLESMVMFCDETALRRKVEAISGIGIDMPVRFESTDGLSGEPNIMLLRQFALGTLTDHLSCIADTALAVRAEVAQALMVALLCGAPHNYSRLLAREGQDAAPVQVRQAVEYIEHNWNKSLLVEDIAAISNVSVRSLFRTFKKSMGVAPMDYVRKIRLGNANRMLLGAGRETSVADVARMCGFLHLGQFAKDYRKAFGERPSETLARTRTRLLVRAKTL